MKIPKEIKVGAHIYKVLFPYVFREDPDLTGQADHEIGEIRLRKIEMSGGNRLETRIISTLIHEIIHCIDWNTGREMFSNEDREAKIIRLAEGLTEVLIDNGFVDKEIEE